MHEYVQKSTSTTLPRRLSAVRGGEFSHDVAPLNDGISPSMGNPPDGLSARIMAPLPVMELLAAGLMPSISDCSRRFVPLNDKRVSTLLSQPNRMATTASKTATPNARLTHSPAPRD